MSTLHLKIITPRKIVFEEDVQGVTVPSSEGEITILPRHTDLFALLKEGIVRIKKQNKEDMLAVGGGYVETDGKILNILVSQAYGQHEIDEKQTQEAIQSAKKIISETKDANAKAEATAMLRRSTINLKLIKRHKQRSL